MVEAVAEIRRLVLRLPTVVNDKREPSEDATPDESIPPALRPAPRSVLRGARSIITVCRMPMTLYDAIPKDGRSANDTVMGRFLDYVSAKKLELYPAQEEAILELFAEKNVILNTPTAQGNRSSRRRCISKGVAQAYARCTLPDQGAGE